MLYRVEPGRQQLTSGVGIVFAAFCVISAIRIAEYFTGVHLTDDYLHAGRFEQFILISYQMLFILLTYSLALMFNKRLLLDIATQEEKFSKAFHSSPYAITLTRISDGQIIEVNESFFRITGYQLADVKGNNTIGMHLWVREEDRALVVGELSSKGKVRQLEFQFRKKSGEIITGLFSAEIINVDNEKYVLSSINDITERKQAEEAIRETSDYLNSLIDYANAPIITWDTNYIITRFNHAFEKLAGYSASQMVGVGLQILFPQESRDESLRKIALASSGEFWESVEIPIKRQDGEIRVALWNSANILNKEGKEIVATIAQGQDITERKLAEAEIIRLNTTLENKVIKRTNDLHDAQLALVNIVEDLSISNQKVSLANQSLEATNKELEAFSYSVSHDLRAPLRSIDGFSLALLEDYSKKLDGTGRNYLERIRTAAQHMAMLIDDMLKLSRISRFELRCESVDLSKMFREIAKNSQKNDPARIIDLIIQEGIMIECDPAMMNMVLKNLIDNAWKFTGKEARPKIEFGTTDLAGKKVIFIRDNGVGFDMAYLDKMFGSFQRLHTKDEFAGTGIGLAIVKRVITLHGGKVWAEGEVGKGAVFYFTLP